MCVDEGGYYVGGKARTYTIQNYDLKYLDGYLEYLVLYQHYAFVKGVITA